MEVESSNHIATVLPVCELTLEEAQDELHALVAYATLTEMNRIRRQPVDSNEMRIVALEAHIRELKKQPKLI